LDAESEIATPGETAQQFGLTKYARLQEIKKQYDPKGLFSKFYGITPAA